jgi:hypothetical protein
MGQRQFKPITKPIILFILQQLQLWNKISFRTAGKRDQ